MHTELIKMRNIGEKLSNALVAINIRTPQQLREIGAVKACEQLADYNPFWRHKMCLYALQAALLDINVNELPNDIKQQLLAECALWT